MSTTNSQPLPPRPPQNLQGPDFVVAKVAEWTPGADGGLLTLNDGSSWKIRQSDVTYEFENFIIVSAQQYKEPIFVSGDRRTGQVERLEKTELLAPFSVDSNPTNGRLRVLFHMKPSFYHLSTDRPWYQSARTLLDQALNEGRGQPLESKLLVSTDSATLEIMDLQRPQP